MCTPFKRISCDGKIFWNIPVIGIGTYQLKGIECQNAIHYALQNGYRHIDTAECYKNESHIGNAIKSFNLKYQQNNSELKQDTENHQIIERKDIFITSKLSPRSMKSQNKIESAINDCLKSLHTNHIDLYLIHWPGVSGKKINDPKLYEYRLMAWKIMEKYVNKGSIRCIGVSNFEIKHLKPLIDGYNNGDLQYKPAVNQIEFHPLYQRYDLFEYCNKNNIQIMAYGSLGANESHKKNMKNGKHILLNNDIIMKLCDKYNKTTAQILIKYGIQHSCVVIPKSINVKHIKENIEVFEFEIDKQDMTLIDNIVKKGQKKFAWDPSNVS